MQEDYMNVLQNVVKPAWKKGLILLEDNDGPHGTRGAQNNKVRRLKNELGIECEANPRNSPDLNAPIEKTWRILKQRDKKWRARTVEELKAKLQAIWDGIKPKSSISTLARCPKG